MSAKDGLHLLDQEIAFDQMDVEELISHVIEVIEEFFSLKDEH